MKRLLLVSGIGTILIVSAFTIAVQARPLASHRYSTFKYSTFSFPFNQIDIVGVQSINKSGTIAGYYEDTSNDYFGWVRSPKGTFTVLSDPADTSTVGFTAGFQVNDENTVVGVFYDTADDTYSGFFYQNGKFTTYNAPDDLPPESSTGVYGINDEGEICGFVSAAPDFSTSEAFVGEVGQKLDIFSEGNESSTWCTGLSNRGYATGYYEDENGNNHGFLRSPSGKITTIDFPGASSTPTAGPCDSFDSGTIAEGVNDSGVVSGHFWDKNYNEHGYVRYPDGSYRQLGIPGAYQTAGGNINDAGTMTGHYLDNACEPSGYTAELGEGRN